MAAALSFKEGVHCQMIMRCPELIAAAKKDGRCCLVPNSKIAKDKE
jgi:hypothetical protein